jgi:hypothetical protein
LTSSWGSILEDEFADPISRKFLNFAMDTGAAALWRSIRSSRTGGFSPPQATARRLKFGADLES